MKWFIFIELWLKAASAIVSFLGNQRLIEAGQAMAVAEGLKTTVDNMEKANAVRADIHAHPDSAFAGRVREKYRTPAK